MVEVGNLRQRPAGAGKNQVGALAGRNRSALVADAHCVGTVERDGVKGLVWREAHPDAAQGPDPAHIARGG